MEQTHDILSGKWFATVPRSMEGLLAEELRLLGASDVKETLAGVTFGADLKTAYRVIMWTRLASRILMKLSEFEAADREALYNGTSRTPWNHHIPDDCTFMIQSSVKASRIHNSEFAAQVVKDAIVDQFRTRTGKRPSVDRMDPGVIIHVFIHADRAVLSLDMTRSSLHHRGYRIERGDAPLRENVAAGMLIRAGWPDRFDSESAILDPMCGVGTIVIEAAMMAADVAPGILPGASGRNSWKGHDTDAWNLLMAEAEQRRRDGLKKMPVIIGIDKNGELIEKARRNAARAQLEHSIDFQCVDFRQVGPPEGICRGLIAVNPPYGKRMESDSDVTPIYNDLGKHWSEQFVGWKAVLITSDKVLARSVGMRASKINTIYNGAIQCALAQFDISPENEFRQYDPGLGYKHGLEPRVKRYDAENEAFGNRLRKNSRILRAWLKKNGITCYRLYDADMPNYALALDIYENRWAVIQEYAPPATIDPVKANDRLHGAVEVVRNILDIDPSNIFLKQRRRQVRNEQYEKTGDKGRFEEIHEGGLRFLVNFTDYLDTGIFLDHRLTRDRIRNHAGGMRFLNLFSYTGTATVYALAGGAILARSVDSSNTYLSWAEANLRRNGFNPDRHPLVRGDVMEWLLADRDRYDLILCDPPTYSVSKDRDTFDVQKDHIRLIQLAVKRLSRNGILIFSTHFSRFSMDADSLAPLSVAELSRETIPRDFERHKNIHRCWMITADAVTVSGRKRPAAK